MKVRFLFLLLCHYFLLCLLCIPVTNVHEIDAKNIGPYKYPLSNDRNLQEIYVGIIRPKKNFKNRQYNSAFQDAFREIEKQKLKHAKGIQIIGVQVLMEINPTPTAILNTFCTRFLPLNISAIIFLTNWQKYGRATASSQYFLQLAGYLRIPVIAWNADNSGLEQAALTGLRIQIAPSIRHQASAMMSILVRYQWRSFTIMTTRISGFTDFIQAVRDQVKLYEENTQGNRFTVIDTIVSPDPSVAMAKLAASEARVIFLYATLDETSELMKAAEARSLTNENYVWIVTQSVIADRFGLPMEDSYTPSAPDDFPVGMLGVYFPATDRTLMSKIEPAILVYAHGVNGFLRDERHKPRDLQSNLSCDGRNPGEWYQGITFYRNLKNVSIESSSNKYDNLSFHDDGTLENVELKILNLRTGIPPNKIWEEIGTWRSGPNGGLEVNDIVWPGNGHVPPPGVPEKFQVKIAYLEEPPYISISPADPVTHHCSADRGVPCKIPPNSTFITEPGFNVSQTKTMHMCCSGFCIDLLQKLAHDTRFTYELVRVADGKWGSIKPNSSKWNGLVGELMKREGEGSDMALSSFKINRERESAIDFTVPFLESGITILVAKRTGIISPTAFLEPFDTASWMLVAFVAIQVAALTIFIFEWLSPDGYNMRMSPPHDHRFSLFRTYWLVWAVLFQAAVHVDCPRGFTARFMANMWAMFAVVFLAIYTANLAAFMITREEFHDISGINDTSLQNPHSRKPPFKFGTVPETNAASVFQRHHISLWNYMASRGYNKPSVMEGIKAIKKNKLDAFIYDATVLDYLVGQDDDCQILTVGSWYAMTGYGLAFPRGSKHLALFNKKIMEYKDNGEIERLQRFWLTGTCKPKKQQRRASEPLAIEQFFSAYVLLMIGTGLAAVLLFLEHIYFKYFRKRLAKKDTGGCCGLLSLSMGKSLTFRGAVYEAQGMLRKHRCQDPICDAHIWRTKQELQNALLRIQELEKDFQYYGIKPSSNKTQHFIGAQGGCNVPGGSAGGSLGCVSSASTENDRVTTSSKSLFGVVNEIGHKNSSKTFQSLHELPTDLPTPPRPKAVLQRRRSFEHRSPDSPLEGLLRPTSDEIAEIETVL